MTVPSSSLNTRREIWIRSPNSLQLKCHNECLIKATAKIKCSKTANLKNKIR